MATLGEELREAREKQGLTLEQIAETTRISHTFLKALEEDNYSVIPGEVFITGFLRSYARELGLDENHVLARFRDVHPAHREEVQQEAQPGKVQHTPKPALLKVRHGHAPKKRPLYLIILGGLLLGALLTGITVLLTPKERKPEVPPVPVVAVTPKPTPTPQQFNPATTAFKPATTAGKVQPPPVHTPAPTPTPTPSVLKLKLTASDDCWYFYRTDARLSVRGMMKKGEVMEVTAKESIVLTLGDAGAVTAEYNGKRLASFGKHGVPAKNLLFTKDVAGVPTTAAPPPAKGAMPVRTSHKRR